MKEGEALSKKQADLVIMQAADLYVLNWCNAWLWVICRSKPFESCAKRPQKKTSNSLLLSLRTPPLSNLLSSPFRLWRRALEKLRVELEAREQHVQQMQDTLKKHKASEKQATDKLVEAAQRMDGMCEAIALMCCHHDKI